MNRRSPIGYGRSSRGQSSQFGRRRSYSLSPQKSQNFFTRESQMGGPFGRSRSLRRLSRPELMSMRRQKPGQEYHTLAIPGQKPSHITERYSAQPPKIMTFREMMACNEPWKDWRPPIDSDPYIGMAPHIKAEQMRNAERCLQIMRQQSEARRLQRQRSLPPPQQSFGSQFR